MLSLHLRCGLDGGILGGHSRGRVHWWLRSRIGELESFGGGGGVEFFCSGGRYRAFGL